MLSGLPVKANTIPRKPEFKGPVRPVQDKICLGVHRIPDGESILYFSDFHSNVSKFPKLAGLINYVERRLKNEKVMKVCAGDFNFGREARNSNIIQKFFNRIKLNYLTLGNHDFDISLKSLKEILTGINAKTLVANLAKNPEGLPVKNNDTIRLKQEPYGVVGITLDPKSDRKNQGQMNFEQTVKALQDNINELTRKGIKKIVLISHLGFEKDKKVAQQTSGIDIIISSHNHYAIDGIKKGVNIFETKSHEPVAILQAAKDNRYLGYARVKFDWNGILTKIFNKTISTSYGFIKEDASIKRIINKAFSPEAIGYCRRSTSIDSVNYAENALANWLADTINSELPSAQIVLLPSRMIRSDLKKGPIKEIDLEEMMPDRNSRETEAFNIVKLTGKKLVELISGLNRLEESPFGKTLVHVSGIKYRVDKNFRVVDMKVLSDNGKFVDINVNKTYKIALPGYLINMKKLGNFNIKPEDIIDKTDKTARELLQQHFKKGYKTVNPEADGRIKLDIKPDTKTTTHKLPHYIEL